MKGVGGCRSIGIHIPDEVGQRGELQPFDQCAPLADGLGELQSADGGEVGRDLVDDSECVVAAAVQNNDELEFTWVVIPEIGGIIAQNGLNAAFLVVGRDEQEDALGIWVLGGAHGSGDVKFALD